MAITTATETRATLGIDEALAHETFRYASSAALDTAVTAAITRAEAWLKSRASSTYYDGTDPGPYSPAVDTLFGTAEDYVAGHFLMPRLKVRKVIGTHFALDQEGSERFEELIDVEFLKLAEELVQPYLDTELTEDEAVFSLGVFATTEPFDRLLDLDDVTKGNQRILDEASGLLPWPPP